MIFHRIFPQIFNITGFFRANLDLLDQQVQPDLKGNLDFQDMTEYKVDPEIRDPEAKTDFREMPDYPEILDHKAIRVRGELSPPAWGWEWAGTFLPLSLKDHPDSRVTKVNKQLKITFRRPYMAMGQLLWGRVIQKFRGGVNRQHDTIFNAQFFQKKIYIYLYIYYHFFFYLVGKIYIEIYVM
jgi:hypothetical protein